jgi:anaerobic selenocysteine-containing dehydrogenase
MAEGRSNISGRLQRAYEQVYAGVSMDHVAAATGIPREQLIRIGREFSMAAAPLAMGGGAACGHTNGTDSMLAVNGLNAIAGNLGRPGGVHFYRPAAFDSGPSVPWLTERTLMELAQRKGGESPTLWLIYDANPVYAMPSSIPVRGLFERAHYVASFSSFLDDTTALADLVLPDHSPLEAWGDHVQPASSPTRAVSLQQPAVVPLYDTRAIGDTFLQIAAWLKLPEFAGWENFPALMQARWRDFLTFEGGNAGGEQVEDAWIWSLQQGGWWREPARNEPVSQVPPPPAYEPCRFDGDEPDFPLHLLPYPAPHLGYGRGASLPWLQELPDTLTTVMWGSWAEINPATARRLDINQGDVIRVHSRHGALEVPALHFPGIRPDVIAIPIGQGHGHYGRYASGRGINPLSILAPLFDRRSGALATGATRVRIEKTGMPARLALLERPGVQPGSELLTIRSLRH